MLNYIWSAMIFFSFVVAFVNGKLDDTTKALFEGAAGAVQMCLSLAGIMCLWMGLMKIAEKSGLIAGASWLLSPFIKLLFPKIKRDSAAYGAIVGNIMANLFGMSNAATPLGLKAMKELQKINGSSSIACNEMCMFVVINTASLQLVPSTVIAMRQVCGSTNPSSIIVPVWICSVLSVTAGVLASKVFSRRYYT